MKKDKISLKWKLFLYILILACSIILLFSVFQILLLDDFYRSIKTKDINNLTINSVELINESVDSSDDFDYIITNNKSLHSKLASLATDNEAFIYVFKKSVNNCTLIYETGKGGSYLTLNDNISTIWEKAERGNFKDNFYIIFRDDPNQMFDTLVVEDSKAQEKDYLISGCFLSNEYILIVDSRLTPVEPAVMAMKYQIMYISLIVIVLAIVVAVLLSRVISKPIITINDSAKKMAEGNLDVEFKGHGYKEITELNNTLNHTVEELKKTETLQRELLANVSHDLRTPLTLISGYAEMMKDIPEENTEENIQIIVDETKRLSMLVNDLLSLSRIKSRTEELNLIVFDIKELLDNIIDRQNKFFENINAKINLITTLDHVYVKADLSKIEQVMYNFITNAINYSKDDKIVDVILEVNNNTAIIKVKDYGIGIKEENLEYIWQRYYRVDKGLKRSTQGTGLGLSIIKEILEYHGFKYGVESIENVGSTFYFEMPIESN